MTIIFYCVTIQIKKGEYYAYKNRTKTRVTFTLSPYITKWINSKAQEYEISRSELVNQLLNKYYQREKEKKMEDGYKSLGDILKITTRASLSLQKKVLPDY